MCQLDRRGDGLEYIVDDEVVAGLVELDAVALRARGLHSIPITVPHLDAAREIEFNVGTQALLVLDSLQPTIVGVEKRDPMPRP